MEYRMKKKIHRIILGFLALLLVLSAAQPAFAGWIKEGKNWYYEDNAGQRKTGWVKDGNKWYLLNPSGAMLTGWQKSGGKWYYLAPSGVMQTGWINISGKWYYLNRSGVMQTGWLEQGSKIYYFKSNGTMATGWQYVSGTGSSHFDPASGWYYFNSNGTNKTGWLKDNGSWYYLGGNQPGEGLAAKVGRMYDGVLSLQLGGKEYVFDKNGKWIETPGFFERKSSSTGRDYKYYIKADGTAKTGWFEYHQKWYFLDPAAVDFPCAADGKGKIYFFDSDGALVEQEGWHKGWNSSWYYTDSKGVCVTGWKKISGKWYYFFTEEDYQSMDWMSSGHSMTAGEMAYSMTLNLGGKNYTFDANGVWVK